MFLLTDAPAIEQPAPEQTARVTIAIRGERPTVAPGYLMTTAFVVGIDEAGEARAYFVPAGPDTPLPTVGSRCELHYAPGQLDMVGGLTGDQLSPRHLMQVPIVSRFDCDATDPT